MTAKTGRLLLVPNALDLAAPELPPLDDVLPARVIREAARLSHWVAEDARSARAFLKRVSTIVPLARALQAIDIQPWPRLAKGTAAEPDAAAIRRLLEPARAGADIGLLSEAGLPAVADPGAALVAAAHQEGIEVVSLPGPSSITLALAASGLQGQSFTFVGYLPTDGAERATRLRALEAASRRERQTQIAIETPYRNATLMQAMMAALHPETRLAVACGLTLPGGWCRMATIARWQAKPPAFESRHLPAIFLWQAR